MSDWWGSGPTRPTIRSDKGIQARSQRGAFAKHWWASRWIEAMEHVMDAGRLGRGRSYARKGQVLSLFEVKDGIEAQVQGSRPKPYKVRLALARLTSKQWDAVLAALANHPALLADLLAGAMPEEIETAFEAAGVALFPASADDIEMACSCPDWSAVCKHIAAVHYILAERFDTDPFLLFRLRGRSEAEVMAALRARQAEAMGRNGGGGSGDADGEDEVAAVPSLEESVGDYWRAGRGLDAFSTDMTPPALPLPVLKRLGPPPFADKDTDVARLLGPAYGAMARRGREVEGGGSDKP